MNQTGDVTARGEPILVGDHPAIDLLNTLATPVDLPVDWLRNGDDLIDWLRKTGGVSPAEADLCRRKFSKAALDDAARQARAFREWLRQLVRKQAGKSSPTFSEPALEPLNALLSKGRSHGRVVAGRDSPPKLLNIRTWSDPGQLLQPLAESAADLICHADFSLLRQCEGTGCTLFFLDVTKGHQRRWCSMAVCGNRAKAAAHRQRLRA
jgi:predicted RNA-binding Zn ribbon-like protein